MGDESLTQVRTVAVFDLDGTITRSDTLLPYLLGWLRRHPRRTWQLWRLPAWLLGYAAHRDRGRLKGQLINGLMGGATRAQVLDWSRDFVASSRFGQLRAGAQAAIERHRAAGDRLVLMSASVDLYVPLLGRHLGFERAVCSRVKWDGERLAGTLAGANCRGMEKVRQLLELRAAHPGWQFAAYGNAASDLPHLRAADRPLLVNASRGARRGAREIGLPVAEW